MEAGHFLKWPIHWKPVGKMDNLSFVLSLQFYLTGFHFIFTRVKQMFYLPYKALGASVGDWCTEKREWIRGLREGGLMGDVRRHREMETEAPRKNRFSAKRSRHSNLAFEETPYSHLTLFCSSFLFYLILYPVISLVPIFNWRITTSTFSFKLLFHWNLLCQLCISYWNWIHSIKLI